MTRQLPHLPRDQYANVIHIWTTQSLLPVIPLTLLKYPNIIPNQTIKILLCFFPDFFKIFFLKRLAGNCVHILFGFCVCVSVCVCSHTLLFKFTLWNSLRDTTQKKVHVNFFSILRLGIIRKKKFSDKRKENYNVRLSVKLLHMMSKNVRWHFFLLPV